MSVVSLVPAHDRPYVDGSCNDSVFSQVFLYNGADRLTGKVLDQPGCAPAPVAVPSTTTGGAPTVPLGKGPARFLSGPLGRDAAWLFIPATVGFVGILVARRRRPRTDPWHAAALLWGFWMVLTWAFFASSQFLNSYYLAALAPPMAALCGLGLALAWRMRHETPVVPAVVLVTVVATLADALFLTPRNAGVWPWMRGTGVLLAAGTLASLTLWLRSAPSVAGRSSRVPRVALVLSATTLLLGAAWASATAVTDRLGPFDSPYQPAAQTALERTQWFGAVAAWPALSARAAPFPMTQSIETTETSTAVSLLVLGTGREFLPVGGFSGQVPSTPLPTFMEDVQQGRVAQVLVAVRPLTRNADLRWVLAHCGAEHAGAFSNTIMATGRTYHAYLCTPADAAR